MELPPWAIGLLPIAAVVVVYFLVHFYRKWRDRRVRETPFDDTRIENLERSLPFYQVLTDAEQQNLKQKINLFLADKQFYGCAGLKVTEEMRMTIAAEACLLILNHEGDVYPGLASILVYPRAFVAERSETREDGTVGLASRDLLGESWDNGRVILAWDAVAHGAADFNDGNNVVLHEFAHQLDSHTGRANGAPPLISGSHKSWARVLSKNFEDLRKRSESGFSTVMDAYGATNPAEFFAVATETFFEKPEALYDKRPDLFEELKSYYRLDPRDWTKKGPNTRA